MSRPEGGEVLMDVLLADDERLHPNNRCWIFQRLTNGKGADEQGWESQGTYAFDIPFGIGLALTRKGLPGTRRRKMRDFLEKLSGLDGELDAGLAELAAGVSPSTTIIVRGTWRLRPDGKAARSWILERAVSDGWKTASYPGNLSLAARITREADLRSMTPDAAQGLGQLAGTMGALNGGFLSSAREATAHEG